MTPSRGRHHSRGLLETLSRKAAKQHDDKRNASQSEQTMRIFRFGLVFVVLTWNVAYGAVPDYTGQAPQPAGSGLATAVFAGGCFWGVDAVFKHVNGVSEVVSGYAGGSAATAHYPVVGTGTTGHAESVKITYDPTKIS